MALLVLYTSRAGAGLLIVVLSVTDSNATRGNRKPRDVLWMSKAAEALGVVVPMPIWASARNENVNSTAPQKRRTNIRSKFPMVLEVRRKCYKNVTESNICIFWIVINKVF